jgi:hypothetical protein
MIARVDVRDDPGQREIPESNVENRGCGFGHISRPGVVRMKGPADLAGRVRDILDRDVHVSDHMAGTTGKLDRQLPEVTVAGQDQRSRVLRDLLSNLLEGARLLRQVATDIRKRLVRVNVANIAAGHRA